MLDASAIDEAVTPQTRLCILTHASNVTGTLQPVRELIAAAHRYGLLVLLDAAQTAGTLPLDDTGADMIAMPGHKGLLGPMGTGILYVGEHAALRPLREGGTGSASESVHQPLMLPTAMKVARCNCRALRGFCRAFVLRRSIRQLFINMNAS